MIRFDLMLPLTVPFPPVWMFSSLPSLWVRQWSVFWLCHFREYSCVLQLSYSLLFYFGIFHLLASYNHTKQHYTWTLLKHRESAWILGTQACTRTQLRDLWAHGYTGAHLLLGLDSKRISGSLQGNITLTGEWKLRNVLKAGFIILATWSYKVILTLLSSVVHWNRKTSQ